MERDHLTEAIYAHAQDLGLYSPKMRLSAFCRTDFPEKYDGIYCGEVYSDSWHVKVFDDCTFQIGWLELDDRYGTILVTKKVTRMSEVKDFLRSR